MWELTKRISLRISTVLSKVEPEPGAGPLHRLRPKSTDSATLMMRSISSSDLILSLGRDALANPNSHTDHGLARAARPQHGHAPVGGGLEGHTHPGPAPLQAGVLLPG